jgi:hypothetical protein
MSKVLTSENAEEYRKLLLQTQHEIRNVMRNNGFTYRKLSEILGIHHATLYAMLNYNSKNLSFVHVLKIQEALGKDIRVFNSVITNKKPCHGAQTTKFCPECGEEFQ